MAPWFKKKKHPSPKTDPQPPNVENPSEDLTPENTNNQLAEATPPLPEPQEETSEKPDAQDTADNKSQKPTGLFKRLQQRLTKTRQSLSGSLEVLFASKGEVDETVLEELEELLITSDLGVQTTIKLVDRISKKATGISKFEDLKSILKKEILAMLAVSVNEAKKFSKPHVIMVVGVNGVGKTTTIGKIGAQASQKDLNVLIAAADTFRAAAIDQLAIWAGKANADFIKHKENSDPAAVAFDAVKAAMARETDLVLIDTAGRLHTKTNLMEELKKIKRTIAKLLPEAPHEILLVLDATTGQNAMSQAKLFKEALDINGIALTKLDGTAKGGIVVSICSELDIPLRYIGIGESIEDLQNFDPEQFVEALF